MMTSPSSARELQDLRENRRGQEEEAGGFGTGELDVPELNLEQGVGGAFSAIPAS